MNTRLLFTAVLLTTVAAYAADLPTIPAEPIAKKKELLFSDDFNRTELGKEWQQVVPTFTLENNAMKGIQTRIDAPAKDGKPAVVGHQAVAGREVPTRDSIIEMKFKFDGATAVSAEFDDRKYTGAHYGHICYARITPKNISLGDQKEGSMRNDIYAMSGDPAKKAERAKLLVGKSANFPLQLDVSQWHNLVLETVGDEMRASIDGKAVAFLKSPGIGHPTKSKVEFGCAGHDGLFDNIKIYNAEAVK